MGKIKVHGVLFFGKQGRAKVFVEDRDEPIALAKGSSGTALHGDTVELVSLPPKKKKFDRRKRDKRPSKTRFEVRKIIKRGTTEFLGYLKKRLGTLVD